MLIADLSIGNVYSFSTLSPAFLDARISNAKLVAQCDLSTARTIVPIDQLIAKVRPSLPAGVSYNPATELYLVFETENKSRIVLGSQWIDESSIVEVVQSSYSIKVYTNDPAFEAKAIAAFQAIGPVEFSIVKDLL